MIGLDRWFSKGVLGQWRKYLDPIGHSLQGQIRIGENIPRFLFESLQLFVFGAEMPDEQPMYACLLRYGGSLGGGAVESFTRLLGEVL